MNFEGMGVKDEYPPIGTDVKKAESDVRELRTGTDIYLPQKLPPRIIDTDTLRKEIGKKKCPAGS
jgi:hypothetical protein